MSLADQARTMLDLTRDLSRSLISLRRNAIRHTPAPPPHGLVLDVGSGQEAHERADLVVDKYVADDFERGSPLDLSKPLVVADGQALPFADDTFSYVIASHVLEHATDPVLFAGELSRVGLAGFVQVPSREAELTFGWPFHPWLIDRRDNTLVFHPRGNLEAPVGELFHRAFADSTLFSVWFGAHRDMWHHTLHWSESIPVEVKGASDAPRTATLDVEHTLEVIPRMGARGPEGSLLEVLRCPRDRGPLESGDSRLTCSDCGRSYPVAGGVPVLLAEAGG
jgi:Methyltransferase domain/Trm112p-like protein